MRMSHLEDGRYIVFWNQVVGTTMLLYALTNPIGVVPIFLGLTRKLKGAHPDRVIVIASMSVVAFLGLSVLFGRTVLASFNVDVDDFRIAGGLLALFVAFEMFQAHYGGLMQTSEESTEAELEVHGIAITPLAFPLLVGPAEIGVMITLSSDMPDWQQKASLFVAMVLTSALIGLTLWLSAPITRLIGKAGINVATRVMALIVASIGVHFIIAGVKNQFAGIAHL